MQEILTKIYKYCAYQDRCSSEVEKKLRDLGATEIAIPQLMEHLRSERMLDDVRFVRSFVRGKFYHKKWGKQKITYELRKKRLEENLIETGLTEEISPEDYQETIAYWVARKDKQWKQLQVHERKQKILRFFTTKRI